MPVFALVDCNNFYASCEKLFRPDLKHTPVVVLSNNDGCVVARSKEAKALGIKMGVPMFKIRHEIERHGIVSFSSNYAFYADMSQRVMSILEELSPRVEVYSIDEAFLDLTGVETCTSLEGFGQLIKATVGQWTGIQVCVGIAPTKTLAKLANHGAKAWPATGGIVDLTSINRQRKLMALNQTLSAVDQHATRFVGFPGNDLEQHRPGGWRFQSVGSLTGLPTAQTQVAPGH